jgi:hypothetical protein
MLLTIAALFLAGPDAAAAADPQAKIICKRDRTFYTGSHMPAPKTCKTRAEWADEERRTQRDMEAIREKSNKMKAGEAGAGGGGPG